MTEEEYLRRDRSELCDEVVRLRTELATALSRASLIEQERSAQILELQLQRDQWAALCEKLRLSLIALMPILSEVEDSYKEHGVNLPVEIVEARCVLTATPASALAEVRAQAMQEVQRSTCDEAQTGAVLMYWASITWPKWSTEIVLRELGLPAPKEGK